MTRAVGDHCISCGDVAVALRVLEVDAGDGLAVCAAADGGRERVDVALVEPVAVGDELLVHARTAIARIDEEAS